MQKSISLAALPRPVAAVLGGGGLLGAAHVGVGHALERRGFVPDLIVGTSVGALTGAIAAAHPTAAAARLDEVWSRLRRREVFPLGYLSSRASLFSDRGLPLATPRRGVGAIAWRATVLQVHHQIECDLQDVAEHIPTVVLPTGIDRWPAPWDVGPSQRLISTATAAAERFLTELRVDGPGLYRADSDDRSSQAHVETGTSS